MHKAVLHIPLLLLVGCHRSLQVGPSSQQDGGVAEASAPAWYESEPEIPMPVPQTVGIESLSVHDGRLLVQYGRYVHSLRRQGDSFVAETEEPIVVADEGNPRLVPGTDIALGGLRGPNYGSGRGFRSWASRVGHAPTWSEAMDLHIRLEEYEWIVDWLDGTAFVRTNSTARNSEDDIVTDVGFETRGSIRSRMTMLISDPTDGGNLVTVSYTPAENEVRDTAQSQTIVAFGSHFLRVRGVLRRHAETTEYLLDVSVLVPDMLQGGNGYEREVSPSPWRRLLELHDMWNCEGGVAADVRGNDLLIACAGTDYAARRLYTTLHSVAIASDATGALTATAAGTPHTLFYSEPLQYAISPQIARVPQIAREADQNYVSVLSDGKLYRFDTTSRSSTETENYAGLIVNPRLLRWEREVWVLGLPPREGGTLHASYRTLALVAKQVGGPASDVALTFPVSTARATALAVHNGQLHLAAYDNWYTGTVGRLDIDRRSDPKSMQIPFQLSPYHIFIKDLNQLFFYVYGAMYRLNAVANQVEFIDFDSVTVYNGVARQVGTAIDPRAIQCHTELCLVDDEPLRDEPQVFDLRTDPPTERAWQPSDHQRFPRCGSGRNATGDSRGYTRATSARNFDASCTDSWHPFQSPGLEYVCPFDRNDSCNALLARAESSSHVVVVEERARLNTPTRVVVRLFAHGSAMPIASRTLITDGTTTNSSVFIEHVRGGLFAVGYSRWDSLRGMDAPFIRLLYFPEAESTTP